MSWFMGRALRMPVSGWEDTVEVLAGIGRSGRDAAKKIINDGADRPS